MCGHTQDPPTAGSACTWAWWYPEMAARSDVPMRPRHGKKARCSSLMTPLSMRCGRMPHLSGWYSSWMCGTQSWHLSRDAASLQFNRNSCSLRTFWRDAAFLVHFGCETEILIPWLLIHWFVARKILSFLLELDTKKNIFLAAIHLGNTLL